MTGPAGAPVLVADIGGTNTRAALARGARLVPGSLRHYLNADHDGAGPLLAGFLADLGGIRPAAACIAVAGIVAGGTARMVNRGWVLETGALAAATGAGRILLLNDLQAQAHALAHLPAAALAPVRAAPPAPPDAARLVVNVGTGFNVALALPDGGRVLVPPAEAGHAGLPALDEAGLALARHLGARHGYAAIEDMLSGRGLIAVHGWLAERAGAPVLRDGPAIIAAAAAGDALALAALDRMGSMLGRVAGDLALSFLPGGGLCLTGGLARALVPFLPGTGFEAAFAARGRLSAEMARFAVHVVTDDAAALLGAAAHLAAQGPAPGRATSPQRSGNFR